MELTQDDVVRILKLIDESPMGRVSLQIGELKLEVTKGTGRSAASMIAASPPPPVSSEANPAEKAATIAQAPAAEKADAASLAEGNLAAVKAPLLGIFYRRPAPGAPPFVEEGSLVEENTTIALIEVMKLFTPIKAGVKGRIRKICVENNDLVEYDQVLFLVEPE